MKDLSLLVLIPVFNDWKSLSLLLPQLDETFQAHNQVCTVLVIDDASTVRVPQEMLADKFKAIQAVKVLELKRNLGHQRAIAIGIAYAEANLPCKAALVMDGDGEDTPEAAIKMIEKCQAENYQKIVFAKRSRRSEGLFFRVFYAIYRLLYRVLTGQTINFGNFSLIPAESMQRLVSVSEIWNHYAAGVTKSKIPYVEIPTSRGYRLYGKSKMNFISLIIHGLSAISVYGELVGVRLLVLTCVLILIDLAALVIVILLRLSTDAIPAWGTNLSLPGWASSISLLLLIALIQGVMLSLIFIFVTLTGRNNYGFVPQRDYHFFVLNVKTIFQEHHSLQ